MRALAILFLSLSLLARAETLPLSGYKDALDKIGAAIEAKNLSKAQTLAAKLNGARVAAPGGEFDVDASILVPIENAKDLKAAKAQTPRLKALSAAIDKLDSARPAPPAAPKNDLLDKLRRDEAILLPPRDGEIPDSGIAQSSFWQSIKELLSDCWTWFVDKWNRFWNWLNSLFPKTIGPSMNWSLIVKILIVVFALAAIALVAYILRKNNRDAPNLEPGFSAAPAASAKDADPTSRDAGEWEDYAVQLAAAGRHREAIRAWYHALLVTHFRAGILHYRKGRTNWEYCYALPQNIGWRQLFQDLTGFFEIEWYGKTSSTPCDFTSYAVAAKQVLSQARRVRNES